MSETETEFDEEVIERKPRKPRKKSDERQVVFYLLENGNSRKVGSFPESFIGSPLERRIPIFAQEMYGQKFYGVAEMKADIRKSNGLFENSFDFSISETEEKPKVLEVETETFDNEPEEFSFERNVEQMNVVEVENLFLKERLKRLEEDVSRQKSGNQSEMQTLISALEESRREQRELMMMMLSQSQKPQQDATTQAMNILEKSLGIVTKAKAISEEIAPNETGTGGTFIGDAAKLVDSLGRNAGTFLPMFMGNRSIVPQTPPQTAIQPEQTSNLTEMFNKAKEMEKNK